MPVINLCHEQFYFLVIKVEFRAVLDFNVTCWELRFLFVNPTDESCNMKKRCPTTEIMKYSEITPCLVKSIQVFHINFSLDINHINYFSKMGIFVSNANKNVLIWSNYKVYMWCNKRQEECLWLHQQLKHASGEARGLLWFKTNKSFLLTEKVGSGAWALKDSYKSDLNYEIKKERLLICLKQSPVLGRLPFW